MLGQWFVLGERLSCRVNVASPGAALAAGHPERFPGEARLAEDLGYGIEREGRRHGRSSFGGYRRRTREGSHDVSMT